MSAVIKFHAFQTEQGWIAFAFSSKGLRATTLPLSSRDEAVRAMTEAGATEPASPEEAHRLEEQLRALLAGRALADLPTIDWNGISGFRRAVLEETLRIPAGETRSYGWLAAKVNRPRAARAVGRVMATNPLPLVVPCHRVVGSDGGLHGYGGGLPIKETLLRAEGALRPAPL